MAESRPSLDELGVILDMDRTLLILPVDIQAVRDALAQWGAAHGLDPSWRPILPALAAVSERLRPSLGATRAEALAAEAVAILDGAEHAAGQVATPCPGAPTMVRALEALGIPMALVTNNGRPGALAALETVGLPPELFETLVCRGETPLPKPSPQPFELALRALRGVRPGLRHVITLGDGGGDILAGRALAQVEDVRTAEIQIEVIALSGGLTSKAQLQALAPDHLVETLGEAMDILVHSTPRDARVPNR